MKKKILVAVSLLILNGCVPFWTYDYYAPLGDGGQVEKELCKGTSGPPQAIKYAYDGIEIRISVGIPIHFVDGAPVTAPQKLSLFMEFSVPPEKTVTFADHSFALNLCEGGAVSNLKSDSSKCFKGKTSQPCSIEDEMVGGTEKMPYRANFTSTLLMIDAPLKYRLSIEFEMPQSKCFIVRFPKMRVNDKETLLPDVQFMKDKYLEFFVPINC